ncbi:hypothetical protein [Streptosporangium sp. NPDC000396]|uniref:hypothetical protein n=1 Tax=Streptosporangium sp. NPDC000396 TaxID=3366185 RepID=UPI0036A39715
MSVTDDAETATTATAHLTHLAGLLNRHGLQAHVQVAYRRLPHLVATNPDASALSENIYAAPQEGTWWFWWSWNEKIAPVAEADAVAVRIRHVLTPMGLSR